ncbi:hypothetical protein J6590_004289 [Homalodisca vitripennis]|nr:hypothetical protein J6590_004289 [Homalodisca vitripennis]
MRQCEASVVTVTPAVEAVYRRSMCRESFQEELSRLDPVQQEQGRSQRPGGCVAMNSKTWEAFFTFGNMLIWSIAQARTSTAWYDAVDNCGQADLVVVFTPQIHDMLFNYLQHALMGSRVDASSQPLRYLVTAVMTVAGDKITSVRPKHVLDADMIELYFSPISHSSLRFGS